MIKSITAKSFPILVAGTIIFFGIYGAMQQGMRQTANFRPIELAENAARALERGEVPAGVVPRDRVVDVRESLSPFVMVFDEQGKLLESSMKLDNDVPTPPTGVFGYARSYGEERVFTWQPYKGVRLASTIIHWKNPNPVSGGAISSGFVVAGNGLREVEDHYRLIGLMLMAGWVLFVVGTLTASGCSWWLERK